MESRIAQTEAKHKQGYNCAQSIACTYCDLVGMDEQTMFRLTEGLGLGMGNMEGTCGALSAVCVLAGMKNSSGNLEAPNTKAATYKLERPMMDAFAAKCGSVVCKELKGVETGVVLHSCADCVRDAAVIVETMLFPEHFENA